MSLIGPRTGITEEHYVGHTNKNLLKILDSFFYSFAEDKVEGPLHTMSRFSR